MLKNPEGTSHFLVILKKNKSPCDVKNKTADRYMDLRLSTPRFKGDKERDLSSILSWS